MTQSDASDLVLSWRLHFQTSDRFVVVVSTKWLDRMKTGVHRLIALIVRVCVDLNIFPPRHFGSNADRDTTKRLGQWTTRLYFITLLSTLCIFAVCALVQPQALTSTFEKPSFEYYQQLRKKYSDELKCPCSAIASTYDRFVAIEPVFHQVRRRKLIFRIKEHYWRFILDLLKRSGYGSVARESNPGSCC